MKHTGTWGIMALLLIWGSGTALAFWHFEGQYLRPVSRPAGAAIAQPERLPPPPDSILETDAGEIRLTGDQPVTLLNFWNPTCPCSRFAESDVRRLIQTYRPTGVRFITVIASGGSAQDQREAAAAWQARGITGTAALADANNQIAQKFGVWAAPAAVILDRHGRVAYVGAYNAARYCHAPNTAWASKALAAITQGQKPPRVKTLFFGCQLLRAAN
jgi:hypothetical protein